MAALPVPKLSKAEMALLFPEGTSEEQAAAEHGSVLNGLGTGPSVRALDSNDAMRLAVSKMMGDVADPHFQATVEATLSAMASGAGESSAGGRDAADPMADGALAASVFSTLAAQSGAAGAETIAKTLGMLNNLSVGVGAPDAPAAQGGLPASDAAASTEALSDELISKMMGEFEAMGRKEDFNSVTDNMMRQLLSKDIM